MSRLMRALLLVCVAGDQVASLGYSLSGRYDQAAACASQSCFLLLVLLLFRGQ